MHVWPEGSPCGRDHLQQRRRFYILAEAPYLPLGSLTGKKGTALAAAITSGIEVVGKLHVDAVTETRYSSNVIATTKSGDKQNIVVAEGHTNSVTAGPVSDYCLLSNVCLLIYVLVLEYQRRRFRHRRIT